MIDILNLTQDQKLICARVQELLRVKGSDSISIKDIHRALPMSKTSYYEAFHNLEEILACILANNELQLMHSLVGIPYEEQILRAMQMICDDRKFYINAISHKKFHKVCEVMSLLTLQVVTPDMSIIDSLTPDESLFFITENNMLRYTMIGMWLRKYRTPEDMARCFLTLETINSRMDKSATQPK